MRTWLTSARSLACRIAKFGAIAATISLFTAVRSFAQSSEEASGEANLKLPDLSQVQFLGIDGHKLLLFGILFCVFGLIFGLVIYSRLKNLPVHRSMRDISELIYETCKTYLITQGKFLLLLWLFIAVVIVLYFGVLAPVPGKSVAVTLPTILAFSLIGMAGSYGVAWFGIRVNTFANSRTAFASLRGKPYPIYDTPLKAGMSIGMMLISVELLMMLLILLFIPGDYAGPCFIGFAIGESLGAAVLRIAGGIFTKIADIGSDLMKIVFKIKEDDARNPGVIADCTGDNAGDSVGPSADGFETYGVTGVALITFILLGVKSPTVQVQLLVWIFVMRIVMLVASAAAYFINGFIANAKYGKADEMNYEAPLTSLVWITSLVSIAFTYWVSSLIIPTLGGDSSQWWKLATIISCGTLAGAIIPELVKVFTSTESRHVREVVSSAEEGGASLGILSGFVAGNFSAYYIGLAMVLLMSVGYLISNMGLGGLMIAAPVFAFGLVAFGFLGMGPVTIAVDSYGPVTDNAQSVYELSLIEQVPNIKSELKKDYNIDVNFRTRQRNARSQRRRWQHLQSDRQAGANRHRSSRCHDHDLLDHHGANPRPDRKRQQALPPPRTVRPGPDHRRRHDLLVHRSEHASRNHRRLSRSRIHQSPHQARRRSRRQRSRQQKSSRNLHQVRPEGHAEHLHRGLLRDASLLVRRAILLHRLSVLHRHLRPLPSHLHGQRRRRLGQRQENRGSRAKAKGHPTPRRHSSRRHRRRPLQRHQLGRPKPSHQVHDALRPSSGRASRATDRLPGRRPNTHPRGRLFRRLLLLRLPLVLRHAHPHQHALIAYRCRGAGTAAAPHLPINSVHPFFVSAEQNSF